MDQDLLQLVQQLDTTYHALGLVGALGLALTMAVRVYRMPAVQQRVPARWQWDSLPRLAQVGSVFALALAGAAATALAGGTSWHGALSAGVSAALAAIGLHETTSAVGDAHTAAATAKDPDYKPGAVKKILTGSWQ